MIPEIEIKALTPMENLKPTDPVFKVYNDSLSRAFEDPQIRNLALSGSLGSGKSSIIRSFDQNRNGKKRFLYISLIDFSKAITDAEAKQYDQRQLEYSLLNQILSYCTTDDLPEGSISGIPEKFKFLEVYAKYLTLLFLSAFVLIFHEKFGALAAMFGVPAHLRSNLHLMMYLFAAIVLCGCVYRILSHCLPFLRVSKLLLKSDVAEAEVNLGKERTTLDTHKFELAYILEQIGEKHDHTVVFEDLERLDPSIAVDIMSKLRELNNLTNNHIRSQAQGSFTPIRFLYAIGDSTMPAPYRTKFYDCIIPVVPVSHPLNSRKKFEEMLDDLRFGLAWRNTLCDALAAAFVDYRTLLSLRNEFQVLRALCEAEAGTGSAKRSTATGSEAFLLAITAYKILLPERFERALSPQGDGILPDFTSEEERMGLEAHLRQYDREKASDAVRRMFDSGLLDKGSMRLIIGERELIEQWMKAIRFALDRDNFDEGDEERIQNMADALADTFKDNRVTLSEEAYAAFRKGMTERLGKMTGEDNETQFLLVADALAAVSRKGVAEDWAWGTQEIALRYEKCMVNRYKAQALPEQSDTPQYLKNLRETFPRNLEIALRYAKSLVNLASIQELPDCTATVGFLKELREAYPESQQIALRYAMGLFNLSCEQERLDRAATVERLKELREAYPDNQEIAQEYAMGLVNLSVKQELPERADTVKRLKELREAYPDNQEIAQKYAMGLVNLSVEQKLPKRSVTVERLKELRETYPDNQEIALAYAMGLFNLSVKQELPERADTVKRLKELREAYPDNQEIAQEYAKGLFNIFYVQPNLESADIPERLKKLHEVYPENQEIAQVYAKVLILLSFIQEFPKRSVTVERLKELREAYPDNQEIALAYAMGLFNLSVKQELPERADTVERLKRLWKAYPENLEIAQVYAKVLVSLSFKQELQERAVTVERLKELREAHPGNQEIALAYAMGLDNLSVKQKLPERAATIERLKELRDTYPENQEIAKIYDRALDLLQ